MTSPPAFSRVYDSIWQSFAEYPQMEGQKTTHLLACVVELMPRYISLARRSRSARGIESVRASVRVFENHSCSSNPYYSRR
ncbi:hypothetical protein DM02DRAFT_355368 [Periconia macrospinosa]|uniref:Uncharacterized protein n=1 Tax=Periconia macrospinosa TaxID=97972 RepID=A0A2V1E9I0_9PLEO|nr:hypothetical protein DM02DRAFT_355368 [Periconia macrospinosa]